MVPDPVHDPALPLSFFPSWTTVVTVGSSLFVGPEPDGVGVGIGGAVVGFVVVGGVALGGVALGGLAFGGFGAARFVTAAGVAMLNTALACVFARACTIATSGWPRSAVAISCVSPVAPPIGMQLRPFALQRAHWKLKPDGV